MIKTVICDRCKKEIEDGKKQRVLYSAVSAKVGILHIPNADGEENCYIDLCQECVKDFHKWMDFKPEKE